MAGYSNKNFQGFKPQRYKDGFSGYSGCSGTSGISTNYAGGPGACCCCTNTCNCLDSQNLQATINMSIPDIPSFDTLITPVGGLTMNCYPPPNDWICCGWTRYQGFPDPIPAGQIKDCEYWLTDGGTESGDNPAQIVPSWQVTLECRPFNSIDGGITEFPSTWMYYNLIFSYTFMAETPDFPEQPPGWTGQWWSGYKASRADGTCPEGTWDMIKMPCIIYIDPQWGTMCMPTTICGGLAGGNVEIVVFDPPPPHLFDKYCDCILDCSTPLTITTSYAH